MHVIGVDVSKAKLDCAVIVQVEPMKRRQKVVSNDPQGWAKLLEWATADPRIWLRRKMIMRGLRSWWKRKPQPLRTSKNLPNS